MSTSKNLKYDYKANIDKPVQLRLIHDYLENFNLQFRTFEGEGYSQWETVQEYHHTIDDTELPGHRYEGIIYGRWTERWFPLKDEQEGVKLLADLRARIHTVGDIYNEFIAEDERKRAEDVEAYYARKRRENAIPEVIE